MLIDTSDYKLVDFFSYFFPDDQFQLMATKNKPVWSFLLYRTIIFLSIQGFTSGQTCVLSMRNSNLLVNSLANMNQIPWCYVKEQIPIVKSFFAFQSFNNNTRVPHGEEGYHSLFKVRPMTDIVDLKYKSAYVPNKQLAIDESMTKFEGRTFLNRIYL